MRKTGLISTYHLLPYGVAITALITVPLVGQAAAESRTDTIGPWQIEASFKGDKFDRCSIARKLDDDIVATFVRTSDGLTLELASPNWKLERGKLYPVKLALGPVSLDEQVAAESGSVSLDVNDKKFSAALRNASALNVVAAGATIRVPLDKSTAAFDRLEQCLAKNEKAVETNPFVVPARQP